MMQEYSVGSKIRVKDSSIPEYRWRGTVKAMPEYSREIHDFVEHRCLCSVHDPNAASAIHKDMYFEFGQICNIQHKFIDIEHIRETEVDLGDGLIRRTNIGAFEIGDNIQITEKFDGANASIAYNADDDVLEVFSRTNLLNGTDGLRGFKAYIDTRFSKEEFKDVPDYAIFGEWCVSHKVKYDKDSYNKWVVYDIWDKSKGNYLPQSEVKEFCSKHGMEYIHVLYEGEFSGWDHVRSFLHSNTYGPSQEGVVVKNQTKLDRDDIRLPKYLKIVNEEFVESMIKGGKREKTPISPEELKLREENESLANSIATEARVSKIILKLVDEGKLNKELTPKDMGTCCKLIPKIVYDDLLKEESEAMAKLAENAGKCINKAVVNVLKRMIIG